MTAGSGSLDAHYRTYFTAADHQVSVSDLERAVVRDAICRQSDPEAWFPVQRTATEIARRQCAGCPVIAQCLELSLLIPQGRYGIWGGHTEEERAALKRRPAAARTAAAAERDVERVDQAPAPALAGAVA